MNSYKLTSVFFLIQILLGCSSDQQVGPVRKIEVNRSTAMTSEESVSSSNVTLGVEFGGGGVNLTSLMPPADFTLTVKCLYLGSPFVRIGRKAEIEQGLVTLPGAASGCYGYLSELTLNWAPATALFFKPQIPVAGDSSLFQNYQTDGKESYFQSGSTAGGPGRTLLVTLTKPLTLSATSAVVSFSFTTTEVESPISINVSDVSIPKVDPNTLSPKGQIAYQLFSQMDMTSPTLNDCVTQIKAGRWEEALDTWRDITVMKFRRRDFGYFGWHDYVITHPAPRNVIKAMIGITPTATVLQNYANFNDFRGIRSFLTGESTSINWYAIAPSGTTDLFDWQSSWKGWAGAYWQEGNVTYINKFFDLYVQAFTQAPALWWQLYREKLDGANNGFTYNAINKMSWNENGNHLALGTEVECLLKNLAGFAKSLSTDKPTTSNLLLAPLSTSPSPSEMAVIDSSKLAKIVLGINQNAIGPMIYFSYYAGSVPNQRTTSIKVIALFNLIFGELKKVPNLAEKYNQQVMPGYLFENFLPDGTNLEQSLNYNGGEIDFLKELINLYTVSDNIFYLDKLPSIIAARKAVDRGLMMPLGNLPQIGNNGEFSTFRDLWSSSTYATSFLNSVAKSVTPQSYLSKEFPYAGYFAQRDGWGAKDRYLFFYNNRPQRGHRMNGTLSIQMAAYGRQMVVTAGEPTYGMYASGQLGLDAKGADFLLSEQSTLKTNSVLVDGKQQAWNATVLTAAPQTTVGAKFSTTETFDFVDGTYRLGYATDGGKKNLDMSTTHYRNVVFIKPLKLWLLVDQMSVAAGTTASKSFTQAWNFPPFVQGSSVDKTIYGFTSSQFAIDQTNRSFTTTDSKGPNVEFRHFGPTTLSYSSYYGDRTNWLGWCGTSIGSAVAAMNIQTKWSSNELKPLLTLMIPKDVGQASPVTTVTEYTGSATVSGFDALFAGNSTLSTRTAPAAETLTIGNIVVNGSYLLLLTRPDQQQSGIVLGASSMVISGVNSVIPSSDFSFIINNGVLTTTDIEATQASIQSSDPMIEIMNTNLRDADITNSADVPRALTYTYATQSNYGRAYDLRKRSEMRPEQSGTSANLFTNSVSFLTPRPASPYTDYIVYKGYLPIEKDGVYKFYVSGAYHSELYIGNEDKEFNTPPAASCAWGTCVSNFIGLKKGFHKFAFGYSTPTTGVNTNKLEYEGPDFAKQLVPMPWAAPTLSANITTPTSGSVIVTVTPPATGYKVEYQIGSSGSWVVYSSPVTVTRNTTIQARATDSVGHISTVSQLVISNIK